MEKVQIRQEKNMKRMGKEEQAAPPLPMSWWYYFIGNLTAVIEAPSPQDAAALFTIKHGSQEWWGFIMGWITVDRILDSLAPLLHVKALMDTLWSFFHTTWEVSPVTAMLLFAMCPLLFSISVCMSFRMVLAPFWVIVRKVGAFSWRLLLWAVRTGLPIVAVCSLFYWTSQSAWGQRWLGGWLFPLAQQAQAPVMAYPPYPYPLPGGYYPPQR